MTLYVASPNFNVLVVIINFLLAKNHRENILQRTIVIVHYSLNLYFRQAANMADSWNPNPALQYSGPYPMHELQRARTVLISCLRNPSEPLKQVMPKCGIATKYGRAHVPPPLPSPPQPPASNTSVPDRYVTSPPQRTDQRVESYTTSSRSRSSTPQSSGSKTVSSDDVIVIDDRSDTDSAPVFYSNISPNKNKRTPPPTYTRIRDEDTDETDIVYKRPRYGKGDLFEFTNNRISVVIDDDSSKDMEGCVSDRKKVRDNTDVSTEEENVEDVEVEYPKPKPRKKSSIPFLGDSQSESEQSHAEEVEFLKTKPRKKNSIPFLSDSQSESEQSESDRKAPEISKPKIDSKSVEKIRIFKVWSSDSALGSNPQTEDIYKCDTCSYASKDSDTVTKHLKDLSHSSASLYKAVIETSQILLVSVVNMLDIVNNSAVFKSQIVVCPACKDVFKDIFMCGLHHKKEHGSLHGQYCVCPVVAEEKYKHDTCKMCMQQFTSTENLQEHWRKDPSHHPGTKKRNGVTIYICEYKNCKRLSYNNFMLALSHAAYHLRKKSSYSSNNSAGEFVGRQIVIPNVVYDLPPYDSTHQNALRKELAVVQRLRHFYNQVAPSKSKRAENLKHCRELCATLGCEMDGDTEREEDSQEEEQEMASIAGSSQALLNGWSY